MKKNMSFTKIALIGVCSGFLNGLFGSGGGTVLVPAMVFLLGVDEQKAHATAIFVILPLSIISSFIYFKNNFVNWPPTLIVSAGGMIGAYIGAKLLNRLTPRALRIIFGASMVAAAIRMVF